MDKYVTRMAALGRPRVLLFGRWWPLERGARYRVAFDKKNPARSQVVQAPPP